MLVVFYNSFGVTQTKLFKYLAVMQFMELNDILERATSKSYKHSKIDAVPMGYLHTTLGRGLNEEYSFLLKCYNLQNQGSANKTAPIGKDDFHHQVKNILIRGIYDDVLNMDNSCVGVVIRSPKNLEFYETCDIPEICANDFFNITLFTNSGVASLPNIYLGEKIDSESMDVKKVSIEDYGVLDIENKIIQFERDRLNDFRESAKTEFNMQIFLSSSCTDKRITISKFEYEQLKRNQERGGIHA